MRTRVAHTVRSSSAVIALLCVLGACSNDVSALYASAKGSDGGVAQTAVPLLPALPDEGVREACRTCAASECKDARASCLEDDACSAMLRCKGACSDPACLERCGVENGQSAWYDDFSRCVFETTCAVACAEGQSLACLGHYAVQSGRAISYDVTWHFAQAASPDDPARSSANVSPALEGATVKACNRSSGDCDATGGAQGIAAVDGYSRARMTLEGTPFRGYLELAGGPYDERALLYLQPVSGPEWRDIGMVTRVFLLGAGSTAVAGVDFKAPHHVTLLLSAYDCLGKLAPGLHFLLNDQPIAQIAYVHLDSSVDSNGPTSATGIALATVDLGDQSMQQVIVEARNENDESVASRNVLLRAGWSTQVVFLPHEQGEQ